MDWPNPQDYNKAIQNPAICFADKDLKRTRVEISALGLPRPATGGFASVYKLIREDKGKNAGQAFDAWAVRCFHNEVPDHAKRYQCITAALNGFQPAWAPYTEYSEQGIRVQGNWYPVVKMEWLSGLTLDRFLAKHGANQAKLTKISAQLKSVLDDMKAHGIAHGDLQHGNILILNDDQLRLIDYDGMFVPELSGLKSAELGHPNYQHPYRTRDHFGPYLDNFSAWLLSISFMCLAADPELLKWSEDRECLLFARADLIAPFESPLFSELINHPLKEIRQSVQILLKLLNCPLEVIPSLDAGYDEILSLPDLDHSERIRLIDEISNTDVARVADRPAALLALEGFRPKKQSAREKLSRLLAKASNVGGAVMSFMTLPLSTGDLAAMGDEAFACGSYKEAIDCYSRALDSIQGGNAAKAFTLEQQRKFAGTEELTLANHLSLRLGTTYLLNNNPAAAVVYFKPLAQKKLGDVVDSRTAAAGLMMAYCQLG